MRMRKLCFVLLMALSLIMTACFPDEEAEDNNATDSSSSSSSGGDTGSSSSSGGDMGSSSGGDVTEDDMMIVGDDSCEYALDDVCDEPEYCAVGTDSTDCEGFVPVERMVVAEIPAGEAYTASGLEVTLPVVRVFEGTEGLTIDNISTTYNSLGSILLGGWVTNESDTPMCFVEVDSASCVLDSGAAYDDCGTGFVSGQAGSTGTAVTKTCLGAGARAPFVSSIRLPSELEGQRITELELSLKGRAEDFTPPGANVELSGEVTAEGMTDEVQLSADIVNSGSVDAILKRFSAKFLVIDAQDHIIASTYSRDIADEDVIASGATLSLTARVLDMTDTSAIDRVLLSTSWSE